MTLFQTWQQTTVFPSIFTEFHFLGSLMHNTLKMAYLIEYLGWNSLSLLPWFIRFLMKSQQYNIFRCWITAPLAAINLSHGKKNTEFWVLWGGREEQLFCKRTLLYSNIPFIHICLCTIGTDIWWNYRVKMPAFIQELFWGLYSTESWIMPFKHLRVADFPIIVNFDSCIPQHSHKQAQL